MKQEKFQLQYPNKNDQFQNVRMQIKTFTHDFYVLQLPKRYQRKQFDKRLPYYKNNLDYKGQIIQYAPVGRIYGTNQFGQKCCCHIHGYFSSLYIKLNQYSQFMKSESNLIEFLALIQSLFRQSYNIHNKPIIYRGQLQQKFDFYGYHDKKQLFLKIYLYNPSDTLKMRQLLGSKIIDGKFFQCYQAHINYFMQMFTDLNILGISDMNVKKFTFRKNLPLMKMFNKIEPKLQNGIMKQGWNPQRLFQTNPQLFNPLYKQSPCIIQIDLSFQSILNYYQEDNDYWSDDERSFDSQNQLERLQQQNIDKLNMIEMRVKVTTALNQIWKDQLKRREYYQIKEKPYGYIDYSNNIQSLSRKNINSQISNQSIKNLYAYFNHQQQKDPLWISFLNKGNNLIQVKQLLKSYLSHQKLKQKQKLFQTNQITVENYNQILQQQKYQLINKVKSRWDYYMTRKDNIINEIVRGDRDQLPEWEQDRQEMNLDEEQDQEDQVEEEIQIIQNQQKNQIMVIQQQKNIINKDKLQINSKSSKSSMTQKNGIQKKLFPNLKLPNNLNNNKAQSKPINPFQIMMRKQTNTVKYRANFNSRNFSIKEQGIFKKCIRCRNTFSNCWCEYKNGQFIPLEITFQEKQKLDSLIFQYSINPPSFDQIKNQKIIPTYQRPYFQDISDLLVQYNKVQLYPQLKIAQNIDRHVIFQKDNARRPITIKNQFKLPYFFVTYELPSKLGRKQKEYNFQYDIDPPSFQEVFQQFCQIQNKKKPTKANSRLSLAKFQDTFVTDLILMKYQLFVQVSDLSKFYGNPQNDKIKAIFFQLSNYKNYYQRIKCVIYTQDTFQQDDINLQDFQQIFKVKDQIGLLALLINLIIRIDIDLLITYDQQKRGIYYLMWRGINHGIDITQVLSRSSRLEDSLQYLNFKDFICVKSTYLKYEYLTFGQLQQQQNQIEYNKNSQATMVYLKMIKQKTLQRKHRVPQLRKKYHFDINLRGRVNINLNRICQSELKLKSYTIQNVAKNMFNTQFCQFTDQYLNSINKSISTETRQFIPSYFLDKLELMNLITHQLNIIGGIVQKSKIYGADFVSMMQRGSQFKIQAIMCRVTKKRGYLTLSATRNQVANQSILQCRPLVIEPPKQFYQQPVLLFDFQSLYPSIMIAYNICYSTCLGSIKQLFQDGRLKKMGVSQNLSIDLDQLSSVLQNQQDVSNYLSQRIFITPNKVAFVKKSIKEGLISQILLEFLLTRIMIKKSLKHYKKQSIKHLLKERQNALKLFMNVLYGYTGASFTGRMPCSQIADSVVQVSKYCLKKSIDFLNNHPKYKGKVLYGDTDSIFFHLPTAKLSDCFEIGKILALQITKMFPYPMQMKFEKVYQSLVLVSKKRYYGKFYQSSTSQPKYQGKGLQCVRRDGIQQTAHLMEKLLKQLIDTKDLSSIRKIFVKNYHSMKKGFINENYLSLAKEVKFLKYSQKSMPAHGHAAKRFQQIDSMMLPKYGQRMKYVVIQSFKNAIKQKSIPLFEYLFKNDNKHSIDYQYYINRLLIPPLHRVFVSLISLQKFLYKNTNKHHIPNLLKQPITKQNLQQFEQNKNLQQKKLLALKQKCENICKQCIGQDTIDQNNCVQFNCKIIFIRRRIQQLIKKYYRDQENQYQDINNNKRTLTNFLKVN